MALQIAIVLAFLATSQERPELPTIDDVVGRILRTEAALDNLAVTTRYVKDQESALPGGEPIRLKMKTRFVVDRQGRSWYECEGEQANFGPNGETTTYKGRWSTAFDGKAATSMTFGSDGKAQFAGIDDYPSWHGVNPLEFTTDYFQKPITKELRERKGRVLERTMWKSRPVVLVETEVYTADDGSGWKTRYWIDMERGVVVRRAALVKRDEAIGFREYTYIESDGHKEIEPGIWLPETVIYESRSLSRDGGPAKTSWRFEGLNSNWRVNQDIPVDRFRLKFPEDVPVTDRRSKRPTAAAK